MMRRFEYRCISTPIDRAEIDRLGSQGWQLCAVDGAIAWLCRDKDGRVLREQAEQHAQQRGDK